MNENAPDTLTVLPDPSLFRAARLMQRVCLGIAIACVVSELPLSELGIGGGSMPALRGNAPLLLTALLCWIVLVVSETQRTGVALDYARRVGKLLVLFAAAVVIFWTGAAGPGAAHGHTTFPPARISLSFVLLATAVVLGDRKNWLLNLAADVLACSLCGLSLLLLSDAVFGHFALFGPTPGNHVSWLLLICLAALTGVVALRQAEHGVLSIFLGVGIGSRLARIFAPVLLLLPFAWEAINAWSNHGGMQGHQSAAMLSSAAVAIAVGILLFFAWRISKMENEIHDLVLRDESTRLYNFRGFHMLAEHALRLAQRSNVPFSVLYIDLENLALINTKLGPNAAAASLAEAGDILRSTFRESDIKGRIGADEFAVAGQFDRAGISVAALRLEATAAARRAKSGQSIPLKFSMGHVTTTDAEAQETLKELLARAGQAKNRMDFQLGEMRIN